MVIKIIKNVIVLLILLLISFCFVSFPIFFGSNIESYEEFRNAPFGFPIPFIYQDVSAAGAWGYEDGFPRRFSLQTDFLDNDLHITFVKSNFVNSVLIVFAVLIIVYYVQKKCYEKKTNISLVLH